MARIKWEKTSKNGDIKNVNEKYHKVGVLKALIARPMIDISNFIIIFFSIYCV